jgi:hypothetical protein
MPKKITIPKYVKVIAKKALEKRRIQKESRQAGLTKEEAEKLGIQSGVERAKQLVRSRFLKELDIKSMVGFYNRFKNRSTPKIEDAINLWGGRSFLEFLSKIYK